MVREPYTQADIAISILDYLGLADHPEGLLGRSLFRSYSKGRPIYFANTYQQVVMEFDASGALTRCDEELRACRRFDGGGDLFGPSLWRTSKAVAASDTLVQAQIFSLRSEPASPVGEYVLKEPGQVPLTMRRATIFGGQYISLNSRTENDMTVDLRATAPAGDFADIQLQIISAGKVLYEPIIPILMNSDRITVRAKVVPGPENRELEVNLSARGSRDGIVLVVDRATLTRSDSTDSELGVFAERVLISKAEPAAPAIASASGLISRGACLTQVGSAFGGKDCPLGALLYGPYLSLAAEDHVKISYDVAVQEGSATFGTEVVSDAGSKLLNRGSDVRLAAGDRHRFEIDLTPLAPVAHFEGRLHLRSSNSSTFSVDNLVVDIERD